MRCGMKVIIFEEKSKYSLEDRVNDFISKHSSQEIVDIKYSSHSVYSLSYYSAMIILVE